MRNLLEDRSKMSSSLNSVSVPIALSTLARPTILSYLQRTWHGCSDVSTLNDWESDWIGTSVSSDRKAACYRCDSHQGSTSVATRPDSPVGHKQVRPMCNQKKQRRKEYEDKLWNGDWPFSAGLEHYWEEDPLANQAPKYRINWWFWTFIQRLGCPHSRKTNTLAIPCPPLKKRIGNVNKSYISTSQNFRIRLRW